MSSKIEWCDDTWNPVTGCTRVSSGCDNCYAVTMTHRLEAMGQERYTGLTVLNGKGERHFNGVVRCHEDVLDKPLHWRKPRRIFVNSMADLFHKGVPFEFVDRVFAVMALCPQHIFQILTKRPERMAEYFKRDHIETVGHYIVQIQHQRTNGLLGLVQAVQGAWPLPNVHLGTSCEDQKTADERIPHLLRCPAAVRFLSCEPLLGPIDLRFGHSDHAPTASEPFAERQWMIHQVILGGESGPKARPMHPDWARSIRDQCAAAGVPFFFKQWGGVHKKQAGRLLDGVEHNGEPQQLETTR